MTLPIRNLTLYKHGISVIERRGDVSGDLLTLTFDVTQMNDVLKSLVAYDRAGGQIRNVAYDAPEDRADKLERGTIHLSQRHTLSDLLRDLRGRQVEITVREADDPVSKRGTVVGVDLPSERREGISLVTTNNITDGYVTLLADGILQTFKIETITRFQILDSDAQSDLDFFLRASVVEPQKRSVIFRLSEGEHDMVVRYLAPSPTWRVSYRLVGETDENGERTALLQGWGIFDNPFDEELENVQVSLVSGMPISFIYDLYTPFTPQRPVVKEEARVAAAPVEMERAKRASLRASFAPAPAMLAARQAEVLEDLDLVEDMGGVRDALAASSEAHAKGEQQGDLFEYRISTPVTVRRGEAAMVPILMTSLPYRKTYVYNSVKQPRNPMVVLRFDNPSELTLERGPITAIENDNYIGEAIFPFTRPGAEALLPIAVDLGITVTEKHNSEQRTHRISLQNNFLLFEEYQWQRVTYEIQNTNAESVDLLIEHTRDSEAVLEPESGTPEETTANYYRFKVAVPAGPNGNAEYNVSERRRFYRHEQIRNLTYENLSKYLKNRWLDRALADGLSTFLDMQAQYQRMHQRRTLIDQEKHRLTAIQEQARKNMSGLKEGGDEGALRARYVKQLNESEDQLGVLEAQRNTLTEQIDALNKRIEAYIAGLGSTKE